MGLATTIDHPASKSEQPRIITMTPYAATQLVNRALAEAGVKDPKTGQLKRVSPTMLYVYADKGKFDRTRASDGRWNIDRTSFDEWLEGYVSRVLERQIHREELSQDP